MVKVKVCGITNLEDAQRAVYYGAWAIGLIFHKKSPRYVSPSRARKIVETLPPFVTPVGVFVNQKERAVRDICKFARISTVQFHGDETNVYCTRFKDYKVIKAFRIDDDFDFRKVLKYKVNAFLFDTFKNDQYGGTGETFDWTYLKLQKIERPFIVSGGLSPDNVKDAVSTFSPFAVDVSSGVEKSPGIKNPRLIRAFFEAVDSASN